MATLTYEPEIGESICEELASTRDGLDAICRRLNLAPRTVWRWIANIPELNYMYCEARKFQTELFYDDMIRIFEMPLTHNGKPEDDEEDPGRPLDGAISMAEVQRRKGLVDAMKFNLMKLQPKRFGENRNVAIDVKVSQQVTDAQFAKLLDAAKAAPVDAEDIDHEEIE